MKNILIIGGTSGLGWALANELANTETSENVYIVGRKLHTKIKNSKIKFFQNNVLLADYKFFDQFHDIDALFITVGMGRVAKFDNLSIAEINLQIDLNYKIVAALLRYFYSNIKNTANFKTVVVSSIAGMINSPLFSVYASSKAATSSLIESLNIELELQNSDNRILDVRPGHIAGTRFANNKQIDLKPAKKLAEEIVTSIDSNSKVLIPSYREIYKDVIERNNKDSHKFGVESYQYKVANGRETEKPQIRIGYMSGTFDLFHIGHLNMLKKAKQYCDYLVVGVHKDASHKNKTVFISLEERMEIVRSVRYVDEVIVSLPEDSDVREIIPYNYLFVGSDYKGTERFQRYEEQFSKLDDVEIVYFPYTKSTSSTQLRSAISQDNK